MNIWVLNFGGDPVLNVNESRESVSAGESLTLRSASRFCIQDRWQLRAQR